MTLFVQVLLALLALCSWKFLSDMPWKLSNLTVQMWQHGLFTVISTTAFLIGVLHSYGFLWNIIGAGFVFLWTYLFRATRRKRRVLNVVKEIVNRVPVQFPEEEQDGGYSVGV